jgi:membrane protease YdiL (CAAX protease family)
MADGGVARPRGALGRQLGWYFGGLVAVYAAGVAAFWPPAGEQPNEAIFLVVMLAPTVGALLALLFGRGSIQWGRLNVWILAGLAPALAVLGVYLLGASLGWFSEDPGLLRAALVGSPVAIASAAISALGEEIGWRGFLWPTLRRGAGYWRVTLVVGVIWWLYHVPLILLGWYGSLSGIPAFTVAIAGFTMFVGVLTDRSRAVWPSMIAHGAWNGLVATSFAASEGAERVPAFAGSDALLGEFGWLAAITMLILGLLTAWWHVTHPKPAQ